MHRSSPVETTDPSDPPAVADGPPSRAFLPRRALPTGRAVVGALLVTMAAVGAFAVATSGDEGPSAEYLVLRNNVNPGDVISLDDVAFVAMALPIETESTALRTTAGLEGATARQFLRTGTVLDVRDLNGAAFIEGEPVTGVHELTFPVGRDRTPANLTRGDRVTILAFDEREGVLRLALEDVLVLGYDTDATGIGSSADGRLTLALPDADLVVRGTYWSYSPLTVVLTSRALTDEYTDSTGPTDLR